MISLWAHRAWLFLMMSALNVLGGAAAPLQPGRWTCSERQSARSLSGAVSRRLEKDFQDAPLTESAWQKEMVSRQVGYSGEEVTTCHKLTWAQIELSLPPIGHGGAIDALDWVGPRTREFLLNPEKLLKPVHEVNLPRMPGRVHIVEEDKMKIALELVKRNICTWVPLHSVYEVGGVKILNGLFGVSKPSCLEDGRPVLRLIMNLTGSNSTQLQLEGGCDSLPSITTWQSLVLDQNESLSLFQSDMCAAFYLFKVPAPWWKHLCFNLVVPGHVIGLAPEVEFALACTVIPMGWLNSVGIMQEISENLLLRNHLSARHQLARGKSLPSWLNDTLKIAADEDRSWFHVYLDNFCAGERITPRSTGEQGRLCHEAAELAWREAGVISSEKKRKSAESTIVELGAEVCGETHLLGMPLAKLIPLVKGTLWLSGQPILNRKYLQIMAGRWVFGLQFRRPGMAILQHIWKLIAGTERVSPMLKQQVRMELLQLVCLSPLWHCNLGAPVDDKVMASDASETGGAVASASSLSTEGLDFLQASRKSEADAGSNCAPILVISLFNGIGGAFRCYDIVGITPKGKIAVECDAGANRITSRRWPGTIIINDVKKVDRALVKSWSVKFLGIQEIHLWGGFPCTDLSSVKAGRLNLLGKNSILFWEIPRIRKLLQEEFGHLVVIKQAVENVASMDANAAQEISNELGTTPYLFDPVRAVPMRRPRYAWVTEPLEGALEDISIHSRSYWREVIAEAEYPDISSWLEPAHFWDGANNGAVFPTCLKSIPRQRPPPRPAGLARCDSATISRWKEDQHRYPPYQYGEDFIITTATTWRLLSAEEKELLLGYGWNHTSLAWPASKIKTNFQQYDDARHSYLGDSFSIFSFAIVAAAFCKAFTPRLSYAHLAKRMGMAPGFRAHIRSTCNIARCLIYGSPRVDHGLGPLGMEQLNQTLLRKRNHTGSDIRVVTGQVLNSKVFPRQSVVAAW
jgi:site-specific DNA-cytosine methylase